MKPGIHPKYELTTITCACGAVYHVGSTKKNIRVEVCANCHPFYSGNRSARVETTGGRIERFRKKYGMA
ncbi:50S ribosomal protein L31 [Caldinitratiruptor microaerophilus]|uniref:50S ribosomal protein L31 n=1 Tax=Caldinitratiruptor microaerophilus TaxID=671077 RepID=A0AA35CLZ6_9FIRM|nr:50S ribosomal protein L31 [Caldinitratiruptor microaerophilus]BDG61784.1 50S ribosomal protein L31 [Caldinitratiruptor microaerophilus]